MRRIYVLSTLQSNDLCISGPRLAALSVHMCCSEPKGICCKNPAIELGTLWDLDKRHHSSADPLHPGPATQFTFTRTVSHCIHIHTSHSLPYQKQHIILAAQEYDKSSRWKVGVDRRYS